MRVLVDTPVLSLALRRTPKRLSKAQRAIAQAVRDMIADGQLVLLGVVRQELLSGISDQATFETLRDHLRAFPDEPITTHDYEQAADFANRCRRQGIQGSPTDFLICAIASRTGCVIFTTDRDFTHYEKHLPITLHET